MSRLEIFMAFWCVGFGSFAAGQVYWHRSVFGGFCLGFHVAVLLNIFAGMYASRRRAEGDAT